MALRLPPAPAPASAADTCLMSLSSLRVALGVCAVCGLGSSRRLGWGPLLPLGTLLSSQHGTPVSGCPVVRVAPPGQGWGQGQGEAVPLPGC